MKESIFSRPKFLSYLFIYVPEFSLPKFWVENTSRRFEFILKRSGSCSRENNLPLFQKPQETGDKTATSRMHRTLVKDSLPHTMRHDPRQEATKSSSMGSPCLDKETGGNKSRPGMITQRLRLATVTDYRLGSRKMRTREVLDSLQCSSRN